MILPLTFLCHGKMHQIRKKLFELELFDPKGTMLQQLYHSINTDYHHC